MTAQKRIAARTDDQVWLDIGPMHWSRLSLVVKRRFLDSLERLAAIKGDIAVASLINRMPPIEVVPYLWKHGDHILDGRALPLSSKGSASYGVQLPAHVALCENVPLVRSILVHEFSHCFFDFQRIIEGLARGEREIKDDFDQFDEAADDSRLARPDLWFGEEDAAKFMHHDDHLLRLVDGNYFSHLEQLRVTDPEPGFHVHEILIPEVVQRRVNDLKGSEA